MDKLNKPSKEILIVSLRLVPLMLFLMTVSCMFHEYGHLLTANLLGYGARIDGIAHMEVDYGPNIVDIAIIRTMGGVISSVLLTFLTILLFTTPYAKYFLTFSWLSYFMGIAEGLTGPSYVVFEPLLDAFLLISVIGMFLSIDIRRAYKEWNA